MNNTITEIKNNLKGINSRITEAEEWISELEDRMTEITTEEQKKEIKELRTVSETSGTIINAPKFKLLAFQKKRNKGYEKTCEEVIVENFPTIEKEIGTQVQEARKNDSPRLSRALSFSLKGLDDYWKQLPPNHGVFIKYTKHRESYSLQFETIYCKSFKVHIMEWMKQGTLRRTGCHEHDHWVWSLKLPSPRTTGFCRI